MRFKINKETKYNKKKIRKIKKLKAHDESEPQMNNATGFYNVFVIIVVYIIL
jgi:hypothetical protein